MTDGTDPVSLNAPANNHARRSAHRVGICGSGMKSLAALLLDLGWSRWPAVQSALSHVAALRKTNPG
jgi:hypothetical protein